MLILLSESIKLHVHYTIRYVKITLEVRKAICLACVCSMEQHNSLDSDTITIPLE